MKLADGGLFQLLSREPGAAALGPFSRNLPITYSLRGWSLVPVLVAPPRSACGLGKGECSRVRDRIVAQANKPTELQIVVELLQQRELRTDAVERLQERGQSYPLRPFWDLPSVKA